MGNNGEILTMAAPQFIQRRYIKLDSAGLVIGDNETSTWDYEWAKFDAAPLPAGLLEVTTHPDWAGPGSLVGRRWTGTSFEMVPPAPVRVLSPIDFARRFTLAEEAAIDALSDNDRIVKVWIRRLSLATSVNLDHADVVAGLAYLKSVGIPAIWPDIATANKRAAEIRANG